MENDLSSFTNAINIISDNNIEDLTSFLQKLYYKCHLLNKEAQKTIIPVLAKAIKNSFNTNSCEDLKQQISYDGLELALRLYYELLYRTEENEIFLTDFNNLNLQQQTILIESILVTNFHKRVDTQILLQKCTEVLKYSINDNCKTLPAALQAFCLLCKNYNIKQIDLNLNHFYFCVQSRIATIRERSLVLFRHYVKEFKVAQKCFAFLTTQWSWTNKNKIFLLTVILTSHRLNVFSNFNKSEFFKGIRISLSSKGLVPAGQALINIIASQEIVEFVEFLTEILKYGSRKELTNMNPKILRQCSQKDTIFCELDLDQDLEGVLLNDYLLGDHFRFVTICNIFFPFVCKHRNFIPIQAYLRGNCFEYDSQTQRQIFIFLAESVPHSPANAEENLNFILDFITNNINVPCSDFRQTILGKLPQLFNYLSKLFANGETKECILFFKGLLAIYSTAIIQDEYQPMIFSLKLMDLILKSLFPTTNKRVTKAGNILMIKKLGDFLISQNLLSFVDIQNSVLNLLDISGEYDDARELIIDISVQLKVDVLDKSYEKCKAGNATSDINRCFLSSFYARIALQSARTINNEHFTKDLFIYCCENLLDITEFEKDPLSHCKKGKHLFGYINTLNELIKDENFHSNEAIFIKTIQLSETLTEVVLRLLNLPGDQSKRTAASFQVMDESLEILINQSSIQSNDHEEDRKFLLLSFWMTLKACCDLVTSVGCNLVKLSINDDESLKLLERCLAVNVNVLRFCRHKGAIEAAGVSLGLLVRRITQEEPSSRPYATIYSCLSTLFNAVGGISTTRRGAGLTIMLHHIIKNEVHKTHPLFEYAMKVLLGYIRSSEVSLRRTEDENHDNFDALVLHYLCAIVKCLDYGDHTLEYYDEVMMAAMQKIEDKEWTVRNAALQLFGNLIPKIVGQKQATELEEIGAWEPTDITYTEILIRLPKTCRYILDYCIDLQKSANSTSSVILFLEFLSKIEYFCKDGKEEIYSVELLTFRDIYWKLLTHNCEKIRKLSARCLARSHEFYEEIPQFLFETFQVFFKTYQENLRHGLICCFIDCILKINCELKHTTESNWSNLFQKIRTHFLECYNFVNLCFYTRSLLVEFILLVEFDLFEQKILDILSGSKNSSIENLRLKTEDVSSELGYDVWRNRIKSLYKF